MNRDTPTESTTPNPERPKAGQPPKTPSADMQPEDAGTAASGNEDSGDAAESAMKQTSKPESESRNKR